MKSNRLMTRVALASGLATALAFAGADVARASVQTVLTIKDVNSSAQTVAAISIYSTIGNSTSGNFDFQGAASTTFTFLINGASATVTTNASGKGSGTYTGSTLTSVTFRATGENSTSLFGDFSINMSAQSSQSGQTGTINDVTADVGKVSASSSDTLTLSPTLGFTVPTSKVVLLTSTLFPTGTATTFGAGSIAFASSIGSGTTPTVTGKSTDSSHPPLTSFTYVSPGGVPFLASNQITITGLTMNPGNPKPIYDSFSARTTIAPAPEPSTAIAALAGAPLLVLGVWIRRRKAQV